MTRFVCGTAVFVLIAAVQGVAQAPTPPVLGEIRVGGDVKRPRKTKEAVAAYPDAARETGASGVVGLDVHIDVHGNVTGVDPRSGTSIFTQSAIDAARRWQYEPTVLGGVAVPVVLFTPVNFAPPPSARLNITLPSGDTVQWSIPLGKESSIALRPTGTTMSVTLRPDLDEASDGFRISVVRFQTTTIVGQATVRVGGGVVRTTGEPSFGVELLEVLIK